MAKRLQDLVSSSVEVCLLRISQYSLKTSMKKPTTMAQTLRKDSQDMTSSLRIQSKSTVTGRVNTEPTLEKRKTCYCHTTRCDTTSQINRQHGSMPLSTLALKHEKSSKNSLEVHINLLIEQKLLCVTSGHET